MIIYPLPTGTWDVLKLNRAIEEIQKSLNEGKLVTKQNKWNWAE